MAQVALAEAFQDVSILPPTFDLLQAMNAARDLKELERVIEQGERDLVSWRIDTQRKLRLAMGIVDDQAANSGLPKAMIGEILAPQLEKIWEPLDDLLEVYGTPVTERPDYPAATVAKIKGPAGRFMRKLLQRVEDLRIEQYNAIVDWKYGLLGLASEYDSDNRPTESFTDGAELAAFLRRNTAA